jgi:hypothetical protein
MSASLSGYAGKPFETLAATGCSYLDAEYWPRRAPVSSKRRSHCNKHVGKMDENRLG